VIYDQVLLSVNGQFPLTIFGVVGKCHSNHILMWTNCILLKKIITISNIFFFCLKTELIVKYFHNNNELGMDYGRIF